MKKEMKPRRFGVTRSLKGLPVQPTQELALVDAGCFPVFTWQEFVQAEATFLDEDTAVAVNMAVFGKSEYRFETEALSQELPKAKRGPKPTLGSVSPDTWFAIAWITAYKGYPTAIEFAAACGIEVDRNAIYHKLNRQTKDEIKASLRKDTKEGRSREIDGQQQRT